MNQTDLFTRNASTCSALRHDTGRVCDRVATLMTTSYAPKGIGLLFCAECSKQLAKIGASSFDADRNVWIGLHSKTPMVKVKENENGIEG